jgi:hypothetical protein
MARVVDNDGWLLTALECVPCGGGKLEFGFCFSVVDKIPLFLVEEDDDGNFGLSLT